MNLLQNKLFMDSLSAAGVTGDEEHFLRDRSMLAYQFYLKWKSNEDMIRAKEDALPCWERFKNRTCLWDLGTMCRLLGDCDGSIRYTELYVKETPEELVDFKQVYLRYKLCRGLDRAE